MPNSMEQQLSDYLDNLLVDARIVSPRHQILEKDENGQDILKFTTPARIKVTFTISQKPNVTPHFTVRYKGADCSFSLIDGSPLKTKLPLKFQNIFQFIIQMWIEKREDIITACKEIVRKKRMYIDFTQEEDDGFVCDSMHISPEHLLYGRKRKYTEK